MVVVHVFFRNILLATSFYDINQKIMITPYFLFRLLCLLIISILHFCGETKFLFVCLHFELVFENKILQENKFHLHKCVIL